MSAMRFDSDRFQARTNFIHNSGLHRQTKISKRNREELKRRVLCSRTNANANANRLTSMGER